MGWLIAFAVIFLLAILPLGVHVVYNAQGPILRIVLGPVRLTIIPKKKKDKKPKKKKQKKKKEQPLEGQTSQEEQPPKEKKKKSGQEQDKSGGSFLDFLPLVKTALEFLGAFRRKLRIDRLELKLTMAGGDPCNLAVNYGRTWAAVGNLLPQLERYFVIKKRDIDVACDFTADKTAIYANVQITITLGRILSILVRYGIRALRQLLKIMKSRRGGTKNESEFT